MSRILSIVIPVYNEEKFIIPTLRNVLAAKTPRFSKEIVVVDDGSRDHTVELVERFIHNHRRKKIRLLRNKANSGKGAAVKQGLLQTVGEVVIIQDADLEYSPDDYPTLLSPFIKHGADAVYGSRFVTDRPHRVLYYWHTVANSILTNFSNILTNLNLTDMETGYKAFRGDLIRKIAKKLVSKRFGFEPEITAKLSKVKGVIIYEVGISYAGRSYQQGKKIGWKDGVKALWEIFKFNLP